MRTLIATLLVLVGSACIAAKAAAPLPAPSANGWCYDSFAAPNYNGVRECVAVVVPPVTNRQVTADVNYSRSTPDIARNVDVRQFANVFGRITSRDTPIPFPGLNYFGILWNWDSSKCVALGFTPASAFGRGIISHDETFPGVTNIDAAISTIACDFHPPSNQCHVENRSPGQVVAAWHGTSTVSNGCPVGVGQTYYLNIKASAPSVGVFKLGLGNNH